MLQSKKRSDHCQIPFRNVVSFLHDVERGFMRCPKCGCEDSRVIDSRPSELGDAIRRRRECLNPSCLERFTTYERREETPILVRKKDGTLEPFDREKLLRSLTKATVKRSVSYEQITGLIDDIESELHNSFKLEVSSKALGDMVLARLLVLDKVAYVRFASVYREFQDIDGFYAELNAIANGSEPSTDSE